MKSCHFSILLHGGYSTFVKCFVCWSQECVCQLIYKQACVYYVSHAKKSFSPGWNRSLQWLIISTALMFSTLNNRSHMYLFKNVCVWVISVQMETLTRWPDVTVLPVGQWPCIIYIFKCFIQSWWQTHFQDCLTRSIETSGRSMLI